MGWTCEWDEETRNAYSVLVGKPLGKCSHGRRRKRWEDNITVDLRGVRMKVGRSVDDSVQWRALILAVLTLRFPLHQFL
jgi:hypothetical protein